MSDFHQPITLIIAELCPGSGTASGGKRTVLRTLLNIKINLIGTVLTSVLASIITASVMLFLSPQNTGTGQSAPLITSANSAIDCEAGVYSPVQNTCVEQAVFDAEMKRLFAALGIDTSIYNLDNSDQ